jgi:hypothetical protein
MSITEQYRGSPFPPERDISSLRQVVSFLALDFGQCPKYVISITTLFFYPYQGHTLRNITTNVKFRKNVFTTLSITLSRTFLNFHTTPYAAIGAASEVTSAVTFAVVLNIYRVSHSKRKL